ncbi:hypothetical protein FZEAL_7582 [Fusarium zealandicum]|uniref:Fork-head domain-containing protein n=1 Tax=Fusarium zealandicum TaxID=1053134 RepID=A0A8H4UGF9_9HYPO|nr:hypothetical protein FZEAL_7582 [Fusarium zealandicum]
MDQPFPEGEQASSYTNRLLPGHGQQSPCVSELTGMGSYYTLSSGSQDQSPHLSATGSLPAGSTLSQQQQQQSQQQRRALPTHNPTSYASMTSNFHYPPRSHQVWPSPPPGPDEYDSYSYHSSPTCGSAPTTCYNPSPISPRTWSSPDYPFSQPSEQLHHQNQQDIKNLRICTPTSTEGFPVRGPQVLTPFTGSMHQGADGDFDGLPQSQSPATLPDSSIGALSCTNSPCEPLLDTPAYIMTTKDEPQAGEPEIRASPERRSETRELADSAVGAKTEQPYAQLLYRAFMSAPRHALTLQEIYQWFRQNTDKAINEVPGEKQGWQNSIRHNLSMNKAFQKRDQVKKGIIPESDEVDLAAATDLSPREDLAETTDLAANGDPKRSTEWMLMNWAAHNGVKSTTHYREGKPTRRAVGPKMLHHPYNHGFQQYGNPISTKAIAGRKGGCVSSKSKLRGRHYGQEPGMPPTSNRIMAHGTHPIRRSTMPGMYQAQYVYDDMMIPRLETPPQQMTVKHEQNCSPLTPETTAPGAFGLMLPEPSMTNAHAVTTSASNNHGSTAYSLAGGGQGHMYVGASPYQFPYGLVDVTGVYQGNGGHDSVSGGVNERLLGMSHNNTGYSWSNHGL